MIYEPTKTYQNIAKHNGAEKLTSARALIAELVRRYWILGVECSLLEIQKLAWFLERTIEQQKVDNPLKLQFKAHHYGPYADKLRHLLDGLDGSYLKSDKRISDCNPFDVILFNDAKREQLQSYLKTMAQTYLPALEQTSKIIYGFESPFGMELLSTVDWLLVKEGCQPDVDAILAGMSSWSAGKQSGERKVRLFNKHVIEIALKRLTHK